MNNRRSHRRTNSSQWLYLAALGIIIAVTLVMGNRLPSLGEIKPAAGLTLKQLAVKGCLSNQPGELAVAKIGPNLRWRKQQLIGMVTADKTLRSVIAGNKKTELVGSIISANPLQAFSCQAGQNQFWFTGLGARPMHYSKILLYNPGKSAAVGNFTFWDRGKQIHPKFMTGISVLPNQTKQFSLAELAPSSKDLFGKLVTDRGLLVALVEDNLRLKAAKSNNLEKLGVSWSAPSQAPQDTVVLPPAPGTGEARLTLANPNQNSLIVSPKLITENQLIVPTGLVDISVPGNSQVTVTVPKAAANFLHLSSDRNFLASWQLSSSRPNFAIAQLTDAISSSAVWGNGYQVKLRLASLQKNTLSVQFISAVGQKLPVVNIDFSAAGAKLVAVPKDARQVVVTSKKETPFFGVTILANNAANTLLPLTEVGSLTTAPLVYPAMG